MAFHWRAGDGPTLNAGFVALIISGDPDLHCLETLYFGHFSGGGGSRTSAPLDPRLLSSILIIISLKQGRANCFTLIVFLVSCSCYCSFSLTHGAMQCVIVVLPSHTHLLIVHVNCLLEKC